MAVDALVFEDDAYFAQLVMEILKDQGLSAKHFSDGENALENIGREMPNLVLLDVMMPGMDGISICKLIKNDPKLSWMKVAIVSAKGYMEDKTRAAWGKADLYVQKPFNVAEFAGQIQQLSRASGKSPSGSTGVETKPTTLAVAEPPAIPLVPALKDTERALLQARVQELEKELSALSQAKAAWEQERQSLVQANNRKQAAMEAKLEEEQAKFSSAQVAWEQEREERARKHADLEKRIQQLEASKPEPPAMPAAPAPEAGSVPVVSPWKVRFWGANAGPNCLSFVDGNKLIVLDSGSGMQDLAKEPVAPGVREVWVLVNHVHQDHLQGLSQARHWLAAGLRLHVIGPADSESVFAGLIKRVLPFTGVCAYVVSEGEFRHIPGLRSAAQFTMHPGPCLAYRLESAGRSLVFVSDNELAWSPGKGDHGEKLLSFVKGADLLIHDARYKDDDYPGFMGGGHSAWQPVLRLAMNARVRRLLLYHIDAKYSKPERDAMLAGMQAQIRDVALKCFIAENGLQVEVP